MTLEKYLTQSMLILDAQYIFDRKATIYNFQSVTCIFSVDTVTIFSVFARCHDLANRQLVLSNII